MRSRLVAPFAAVWRSATRRPALGGVTIGVVFWVMSLAPTLMPRNVLTQGALSGLCLAIGYGLGTLVGYLGHVVCTRFGWVPSERSRRVAWRVVSAFGIIALICGPMFWIVSQNHQRDTLTMAPAAALSTVPMALASLAFAGVFVSIGRGCRWFAGQLRRVVCWVVPESAATPLTIACIVILGAFVAWPALQGTFASWANDSFAVVDATTTDGTLRPHAATVSAGEGSLVAWEDLGRHGRDFVAHATPPNLLHSPGGGTTTVKRPVRVYVGLDSAKSDAARAALAVKELDRTGAFDRKVLAVVTSTGSGWVDPDAAEALEALYGGDTAIVSQQYSFLPSWIATLLEPDASGAAGSALFEAVHARWDELPPNERPKLLVFGLSLGSYGTEQEFGGPTAAASLANLTARTDGVLLVGPTSTNPIWRQLTDARDPASPVWRPVVDAGKVVRFEGRSPTLSGIDRSWQEPRVLYVQHPSDPVTFWDPSWFWSKPAVFAPPRGEAVVARTWFPVVTGIQGVFDLMAGFGAPPGFGHDYRLDYVRAWAQVAPPPGWTDADTAALEARLHDR